jgi:hypothetical protein
MPENGLSMSSFRLSQEKNDGDVRSPHLAGKRAGAEARGKPTVDARGRMLQLRATGATWRAVANKLGGTEAATTSHAVVTKSRMAENAENE